jgi:hypothetical protein
MKEKEIDYWDDLSVSEQDEINKADVEISNNETIDNETFMFSHRRKEEL